MKHYVDRHTFDEVMVPSYAPGDMIPVRGRGSRLWDQQGREYIDFAGGIAVNALGHCHPALVEALTEQAHQLWHLSNVWTNEPALQLARQLCAATFAEKVFFANSGAEANEAALKLARKYGYDHFGPGKHEIIAFDQAFHGRTLFTVTVGGQLKYRQGFEPVPLGVRHGPFNDLQALTAAISERTCAVILEPIQGEGGIIPAEPAFVRGVRELCDQHRALLIFDEIQTGMGRTGALFAYMKLGVIPDILTTAKALGGGFPVAAMLCHSDVAASLGIGAHGSTFGGNPLACRVAGKVLELISDPELLRGVEQRHQWFIEGLEQLNRRQPLFREIRGQGLLLGCVLRDEWRGRAREVLQAAQQEGLMLLIAGPDIVRLTPSLIIPREDIQEGLARLEQALSRLQRS